MPKGLTFLPSLALIAAMAMPCAAVAAPDGDTVVARVNGEEITLASVIVAYGTLPDQFKDYPVDALYDGILEQLIQQAALAQSRTGAVPKLIEVSLENERRSLLAADVLEKVMAKPLPEADVQAAYDAMYAEGKAMPEYNAAHILVETEDDAKAIKAELDGGADFATLAKEKSTGPSGPGGGDLGWFSLDRMVAEFSGAVAKMEPGTVSDPVQTQFGWHVILLKETRVPDAPALDQVRDQIEAELREKGMRKHIDDVTAAATVERPEIEGLDPEVLRDLSVVGN